jgi:hypothetical protein
VTDHGTPPIQGIGKAPATPTPAKRTLLRAVVDPGPPPADIEQEYNVAAQVIEELAARQVNLHFEVDHAAGTVRVQVLNGSGAVVREIPARSLLDTLSGGGLLVDEHG